MARYQYPTSIDGDHIRILTLKASLAEDAPIQCELRVHHRNVVPGYEALSYCWGPQTPAQTIYIDEQQVAVGESLASALHQLRYRNEDRQLWVDAVCIDQRDESEEKGPQVDRMGDTYGNCVIALVWLGRSSETDESSLGMTAIRTIGELRGIPLRDVRQSPPLLPDEIAGKNMIDYLKAVQKILERPWFTRLWVIQEAALAPEVDMICGNDTLPMKFLTNFQTMIFGCANFPPAAYGLVQHFDMQTSMTRQLMQTRTEEIPSNARGERNTIEFLRGRGCLLLSQLSHYRHRDCKDPRDRIFALLNLSMDTVGELQPDYTKSVVETFTTATRAVIKVHKNLDILFLCTGALEGFAGLPSWVPNFHAVSEQNAESERNPASEGDDDGWAISSSTQYIPGNQAYFAASNMTPFELTSRGVETTAELVVQGYDLGIIEHCSSLGWNGGIQKAWGIVEETFPIAAREDHQPREMFWRTVISNRRANSSPARAEVEGVQFELWWDAHTSMIEESASIWRRNEPDSSGDFEPVIETMVPEFYQNVTMSAEFNEQLKHTQDFNRAYWQHATKRSMFTTNSRHLGLARSTFRERDHVCLLAGAQTAYILRECGKKFQLITEAYVHGVMDGSEWRRREVDGTEKKTFVLV